MTKQEIFEQIKKKNSFLCVGLDTDINKIPPHLKNSSDPLFDFNKYIIDATADYCVAYKPNSAFYEAHGSKGWESMQKTFEYIPKEFFKIADAKRGDIGNTSGLYARAFFEEMNADAITVAPYMGNDSVVPFLSYENKWVILLALTSNPGADDFQKIEINGEKYFEKIIKKSLEWANSERMMYVVGATQAETLQEIRKLIPDHFLLVPGVGSQGGDLQKVAMYGMNKQVGLLVNASRSIIYASSEKDFAIKAAEEAKNLQIEMKDCMEKYI